MASLPSGNNPFAGGAQQRNLSLPPADRRSLPRADGDTILTLEPRTDQDVCTSRDCQNYVSSVL